MGTSDYKIGYLSSLSNHNYSTMQPPIPSGTVLRDRYIVKHVIGQGGMGRTYTAQDTERFNETCVLKEFIPATQSPEIIAKAKELFQREANILYQIKHPQVPEFRATFEADGRLFLVQDYVEGKTYRALMNERRRQGDHFSETEIVKLLMQLLPILSYLHGRNIIHRDVSPENLMLRSQDQLPVLIDFGVVKEAVTQLHSQAGLPQSTMAGKLGYAPPEQMQSGRAYANSDLYALAVTSIVLLTGREPQELFDDHSLTWHWEQFTTVSPALAHVLNRMLGYKPAQRYSSAEEVMQALQINQASLSEVKTYAVGRQVKPELTSLPEKTVYAGNQNHVTIPQQQSIPQNSQSSNGINVFWGILLVLFSGLASWAIASLIFNRPTIEPTPTPTPTSETSSPTPTFTPALTNINKNLEFAADGNSANATGKISADQTITYRLKARKGQKMTVSLTGSGLKMTLKYEDQKPIDNTSSDIDLGYWSGRLPATGAYFITISTTPGTTETNYTLDVQLESTTPTPTPTPTPSPTPTPDPTSTPLPTPTESVPVPSSRSFTGSLRSGDVKIYPVSVRSGQTMIVILREGLDNVRLEVLDPSGNPVYGRVDNNAMQVDNTVSGEYQIRVSTQRDAPTSFAVDVSAR